MEGILLGAGVYDPSPEGLQQLQESKTNITADEDPREAGLWSPLTPGETIDGPAAVCLPAWHQGG